MERKHAWNFQMGLSDMDILPWKELPCPYPPQYPALLPTNISVRYCNPVRSTPTTHRHELLCSLQMTTLTIIYRERKGLTCTMG
jgi:hypothetical protein